MSDPENTPDAEPRRAAGQGGPATREDRLAAALRANLRRRKAAAKKPAAPETGEEGATAQSDAEKPANPS